MSRLQHLRALADDPRTPEGERAAARRALAIHEARIQTALPDLEQLPPGPDLTKNGGPFRARVDSEGRVWVAVRAKKSERFGPLAKAEEWVADRRRMFVMVDGDRLAMVPTDVERDDERQQVYVTANREDLTEW